MEATQTRTSVFSRWRVALATVAVGALLAIPAAASPQADMNLTIEDGDLDASLTVDQDLNDEDVLRYSIDDQDVAGSLSLSVTDERAGSLGWTVTMEASDFTGSGEDTISSSNFSVTGYGEVTGDRSTDGVSAGNQGTLDSPVTVFTADTGSGWGTFGVGVDVGLNVPGGTSPDSYTSTVTVTTDASP